MRRFGSLGAALLLASGIHFMELHGPDGQTVFVNINEISTLRSPTEHDLHRAFPNKTHCIVVTTNGKFVAVIETCVDIRNRLNHRELSHAG